MTRRTLAILAGVLAATAGLSLLAALWLGGRPLESGRRRSSVDEPDAFGTDLVEGPSTRPPGIALAGLDEPEDPMPGVPSVVRTVARATPPLTGTLNILLVGIDRRPGASRGGRADTIIVAILDRRSEHVGLVSVPRDLFVEFPDHGPARINAAYGIARRSGRDGLELLRRVAEDTLAIPIRHAVAVDLHLFERAVDAVGGVVVDVACPLQDNFIDPRAPDGRVPLDLSAGRQSMDGRTAAMYVRSRHGRSDWDRARRQQALLLGLRDKVLTARGLALLPELLDELGEHMETDMTRLDMLRLAGRLRSTRPEHLHGLVLGHLHTEHWTTAEGRWVLLPRYEAIDGALGSVFSAPAPGVRPPGARCPAADVALTREGRAAAARRRPPPGPEREDAPVLTRPDEPDGPHASP